MHTDLVGHGQNQWMVFRLQEEVTGHFLNRGGM